ncbi:hypothetical protein F8G81_06000 [Arthrobacter sp. CDRTa11]|uniref:hypothetical protein n=1 Tax=Arthrobacter sp. CDRTa11 TaxID=2651199 RepID=UPI0022658E0A|nr:hypothetical protein [Arthrobacter sp. CDRTa11]UZX02218.1 hypothetical protein F8G81_06000 [Arthrobacter sp. CDRTa11]
MSGKVDKAAAVLKKGGTKAKAGGAKLYSIATDPEMQARSRKLLDDGKKVYRAATSPEARRAYRQASELIKKARKK